MHQTYTKTNTFEDFYGNLPVRLVAYLVDYLLILVTVSMVIRFPLWLMSFNSNSEVFFWYKPVLFHFTVLDVVCYIIAVTYFIVLTYLTGSTLGKKLFNLTVISSDTESLSLLQVAYRETIGRFLSSILCIGYLIILGDAKKQGIHDKLADTYVIYNKKVRITRVMNVVPPHPNMINQPVSVVHSYPTNRVNVTPGSTSENNNFGTPNHLENSNLENSNLPKNSLASAHTESTRTENLNIEQNNLNKDNLNKKDFDKKDFE